MRKKLLTILLGALMLCTLAVNNVIAETSITFNDIKPNDFPSQIDFYWVSENCDYIYYDSIYDGFRFYLEYYSGSTGIEVLKGEGLSTINLTLNDKNNYECDIKYKNSIPYKAEFIMNGDKFDSIVISGFVGDDAVHNGTFKPSVGLSTIMTNNLPLEESKTHWISGNNELYISNHLDLLYLHFGNNTFYAETEKDLDQIPFLKVSDSCYKCKQRIYGTEQNGEFLSLTFNIDGTTLKSIDASFEEDYSSLNGTYVAPVTIADVLKTVSGGFPATSSSGWVSQDGSKIYSDGDNLNFGDLMPLSSALTPSGNDYKIIKDDNTFTFVMESGVLSKIKMLPSLGSLVSYYPYAYTNSSISKQVGYTGDIEFITNGAYVDQSTTPVTVSVDDMALDYDIDYEVTTGSTHVKLKGSFVSTLPVGTHTLKTSMDGYDDITTQFTITAAPSPDPTPRYKIPNTGVEGTPTNNHSLLKLSSLSLLAIGTYMTLKKKKDN